MALDSILSTPVIPPPPKSPVSAGSSPSSSSSSSASFGADSSTAGSSSATQQSSNSNQSSSDNSNTTRSSSGKSAASRNSPSGSQTQNASSSSQSKASSSATQTQSSNAASNGKNAATQPAKSPGPSFLQTLAQSQADAQDSANATAAAATPQALVTAKGKGKTPKDDTTASAATLGFVSQSLVAAMAGVQQQAPTQGASDSDDSVDGVSLSSATTAQSLVANLMRSTADELKAAGDNAAKPDGDSISTPTTPAPDASASAASSFQSHLGVSSQSQTQNTQQSAHTQVNTPVGASGFSDEVGDKITWMAHQGVQSASLQMTPEHMGPVEVRISVHEGSATVSINAAHADTRAALEQALPRLREMFSTQGLNLTDASVSQQFSRGQQQQKIAAVGSVGSVSNEAATSPVVSVTSARLGLVDTYA